MLNFILGFIACLVIAILWPTVFVVIKAKAVEWGKRALDAMGKQTPPMVLLAGALLIPLLLQGCAVPKAVAAAPTYPVWLEMKEGYADTCAAAGPGGCVPMTQEELRALVMEVHKRSMAMCMRSGT